MARWRLAWSVGSREPLRIDASGRGGKGRRAGRGSAPVPRVPDRLRTLLPVVAPAIAVVAVQLVLFPLPAGAWLQGLVIGLLNALVVLGLMLVYRANRVLNLAQASIGAAPAALGVGVVLFGGLGVAASVAFGAAGAGVVGFAVLVLGRRRPVVALTAASTTLVALVVGLLLLGHAGYVGGLVVGLVTAAIAGLGVDLAQTAYTANRTAAVVTLASLDRA